MSSADIEAAQKDVVDREKSLKDLERVIEGALNMIYQNHLTDEDAMIQRTIIVSAKESIISALQELEWAKQSLEAKEKRAGCVPLENNQ